MAATQSVAIALYIGADSREGWRNMVPESAELATLHTYIQNTKSARKYVGGRMRCWLEYVTNDMPSSYSEKCIFPYVVYRSNSFPLFTFPSPVERYSTSRKRKKDGYVYK